MASLPQKPSVPISLANVIAYHEPTKDQLPVLFGPLGCSVLLSENNSCRSRCRLGHAFPAARQWLHGRADEPWRNDLQQVLSVEDFHRQCQSVHAFDTPQICAVVPRCPGRFVECVNSTMLAEIVLRDFRSELVEAQRPLLRINAESLRRYGLSAHQAPLREQMEQLQRSPFVISSDSKENRTAPQ